MMMGNKTHIFPNMVVAEKASHFTKRHQSFGKWISVGWQQLYLQLVQLFLCQITAHKRIFILLINQWSAYLLLALVLFHQHNESYILFHYTKYYT